MCIEDGDRRKPGDEQDDPADYAPPRHADSRLEIVHAPRQNLVRLSSTVLAKFPHIKNPYFEPGLQLLDR